MEKKTTSIFVAGLTPGNQIIEKSDREGTLVAIMDYDIWASENRNESIIASGVSDENGIFHSEIENIELPKKIRVHIRELGFKYLGFNAEITEEGFFYPAKLEPNQGISDEFLKSKYPNSPRDNWDSEAQFLKGLSQIEDFKKQGIESFKPEPVSLEDERPSIFLSYSYDDVDHANWVEELGDKITEYGVKVLADFYEVYGGSNLADFMNSLDEQDKIVIIMTPNYKERAEKLTGGVGYEYSIISSELLSSQNEGNIVPVLRSGNKSASVPKPLGTLAYVDMRNDDNYAQDVESLVKAIHGKPRRNPPELGDIPDFVK